MRKASVDDVNAREAKTNNVHEVNYYKTVWTMMILSDCFGMMFFSGIKFKKKGIRSGLLL